MMEHKTIKLIFLGLLLSNLAFSQRYKSSNGHITFFSDEILEDITAINHNVQSVFDSKSGQIVFSITIASFEFDKSLMQEHFNEKYMESDKYPTSTFKGVIKGYTLDNSNTDVVAEGELEIHGIKRQINVPGTMQFNVNEAMVKTKFMILLEDYKIKVPELMFQKIAEEIEITIDLTYDKM